MSSVMNCQDSWSLHLTTVHHPAVLPRISVHSPKWLLRAYGQLKIMFSDLCNSKTCYPISYLLHTCMQPSECDGEHQKECRPDKCLIFRIQQFWNGGSLNKSVISYWITGTQKTSFPVHHCTFSIVFNCKAEIIVLVQHSLSISLLLH